MTMKTTMKTENRSSHRRKKRKQIKPADISPGEGPRDISEKTPPISYAFAVIAREKKTPKIDIPTEILEQHPEIINAKDNMDKRITDLGKAHLKKNTHICAAVPSSGPPPPPPYLGHP